MDSNNTTLNLIQRALQFQELENFLDAVKLTQLHDVAKSGGPFTIFAPVNQAFSKIHDDVVRLIESDPELLATIIQYHILSGAFLSTDLIQINPAKGGKIQETLIGHDLYISYDEQQMWVNNAKVVKGDLIAVNGVIHIIDDLLIPEYLIQKSSNLSRTFRISA